MTMYRSSMEHLKWVKVLDKYLATAQMAEDEYFSMNDYQKFMIQELKKAFKRNNNNQDYD